MPDDDIAREGRRRDAFHGAGHWNRSIRGAGANVIGLRGEQAYVAAGFPGKVDLTERPRGDGGKDNLLTIDGVDYTVDCKCYGRPHCLIVTVKECRPNTIYVLCGYNEEQDRARLIGWQWGHVLMQSWPKEFTPGVPDYWQQAIELEKIDDLHRLAKTSRGLMLLEQDERERPKPFGGRCLDCGAPGLYVVFIAGMPIWYCEDHRIW